MHHRQHSRRWHGGTCRGDSSADADPVGAGDATAATLLIGWLKGWNIEAIAAAANRIGAFVASSPGATPSIPSSILDTLE